MLLAAGYETAVAIANLVLFADATTDEHADGIPVSVLKQLYEDWTLLPARSRRRCASTRHTRPRDVGSSPTPSLAGRPSMPGRGSLAGSLQPTVILTSSLTRPGSTFGAGQTSTWPLVTAGGAGCALGFAWS
jgi:hypothetical protein